MMQTIFELLTVFFLAFGVFFLVVAAIGLYRLPDFYHRVHAATKGVTLGITSLLIAGAFEFFQHDELSVGGVITRIGLVIVFQFVANPVGAHLLSKAAHMDGITPWAGTLGDDLAEDQKQA